ncbi:lipopolysaccharide biosynthesis protein [Sphingomonas abietis]|uniref:Oligosaccharide flippase family protein n=1 Tax=Sphingomonas abietis TaxID=3012344 RepID=A0ABY7NGY9_9SPHN|nr:oligosaccharide flippase family protein [Sphingomonas abietis]WBO20815.1 oligosaccharide flippase family protein [Sphingomonas abietis]
MMRLRALTRSDLGRRLALATVSSGIIWAAGTAATFAVGVLLARRLGPAGYGVYGTAIAIVTLLAVPAQFGLPLLSTREVSAARVRGRADEVAALGWWFAAIVAGASLFLAGGLRLANDVLPLAPPIRPAIAAAALLLPALALSGLTSGLLRGRERVITSQLLDVLIRPLVFVAALLAWSQPLGPSQAIGAQVVAAGTIALIGFVLFFRGLPLTMSGGAVRLRTWSAAAFPMTLMEAMRALEGSYAVLVASYVASIADAGLLRVAIASSVILQLPISLQNIVTAPFLAGAHAAGETRRLAQIVAASTLFMTGGVAAVLIVLAVAGRWALPFAFGQGFAGAYVPLMILGGNQLLSAMIGPNIMLLSMTGHERIVAQAFIASVLAGVATAAVLTPIFGVTGTAASTWVVTAIRGVLLNRHARQTLGLSPSLLAAIGQFSRHGGSARPDAASGRGGL